MSNFCLVFMLYSGRWFFYLEIKKICGIIRLLSLSIFFYINFPMAENFGDKLVKSLGGIVTGIVVFVLSFVVLFNTEGRADYSKVAQTAVNVSEANETKDFAYATGELTAQGKLGDDLYLVEGDYAALSRSSEVFSWVEKIEQDDNDVRYYVYETAWVDEPANSEEFNERRGHENYPKEVSNLNKVASKGMIGEYEVDLEKVRFPAFEELNLNNEIVKPDPKSKLEGNYIFKGFGTLQTPEIGDIRIKYSVVPVGDKATVFGRPDGKSLDPHHGEDEKGLYRIFWGTNDDAISVLKNEYKTAGWTWRAIGFFMMWIGLMMILKPVSVAMEIIPLVGQLGKSALGAVTFLIAIVLTLITTLLSMFLHNIFGIIAIVGAIVAGIYFYLMKKQAKGGGAAAEKK